MLLVLGCLLVSIGTWFKQKGVSVFIQSRRDVSSLAPSSTAPDSQGDV